MREYQYEVWGFGSFPVDMLRYDQAKSVDQYEQQDDNRIVYVIQSPRKPTIGRWKSFIWNVGPVVLIR